MSWKQPYSGRIILALVFAVAFLINGGLGLGVGLSDTPAHVNGMSAVVFVFGLGALATAVVQFRHMLRPGAGKTAW